jgi:hypothetical protein
MMCMGRWFVEQRLCRICVNAGGDNVIARKLYARFGAAPRSEHWRVWEDSAAMTTPAGG